MNIDIGVRKRDVEFISEILTHLRGSPVDRLIRDHVSSTSTAMESEELVQTSSQNQESEQLRWHKLLEWLRAHGMDENALLVERRPVQGVSVVFPAYAGIDIHIRRRY